jgi:hypothetical protein
VESRFCCLCMATWADRQQSVRVVETGLAACLQLHGLSCSSMDSLAASLTAPWAHLQLHGLTCSSMGSLAAPWAHLQLHGLTCSSMGSLAAPWAHTCSSMGSHSLTCIIGTAHRAPAQLLTWYLLPPHPCAHKNTSEGWPESSRCHCILCLSPGCQ